MMEVLGEKNNRIDKYLSENKYLTLTMNEMYMYLKELRNLN